eukprot:350060-Chlamydomonas_euryale.AAC.5
MAAASSSGKRTERLVGCFRMPRVACRDAATAAAAATRTLSLRSMALPPPGLFSRRHASADSSAALPGWGDSALPGRGESALPGRGESAPPRGVRPAAGSRARRYAQNSS